MTKFFYLIAGFIFFTAIISCDKDAGLLPNIDFKTGNNLVSTDTILPINTNITVGITASKSEKNDVLKKFNISNSVNGAASTTLFNQSLSGSQGDNYSYDFVTTVGAAVGQKDKYTFTVTNRDGLVNQVTLTVTAK